MNFGTLHQKLMMYCTITQLNTITQLKQKVAWINVHGSRETGWIPQTSNDFCKGRKVLNHNGMLLCKKPKPVSPFPYPLFTLASARQQEIVFTIGKISTSAISQGCKEFSVETQNQRCLLHVTFAAQGKGC